jgi:hypothetical protein
MTSIMAAAMDASALAAKEASSQAIASLRVRRHPHFLMSRQCKTVSSAATNDTGRASSETSSAPNPHLAGPLFQQRCPHSAVERIASRVVLDIVRHTQVSIQEFDDAPAHVDGVRSRPAAMPFLSVRRQLCRPVESLEFLVQLVRLLYGTCVVAFSVQQK